MTFPRHPNSRCGRVYSTMIKYFTLGWMADITVNVTLTLMMYNEFLHTFSSTRLIFWTPKHAVELVHAVHPNSFHVAGHGLRLHFLASAGFIASVQSRERVRQPCGAPASAFSSSLSMCGGWPWTPAAMVIHGAHHQAIAHLAL